MISCQLLIIIDLIRNKTAIKQEIA